MKRTKQALVSMALIASVGAMGWAFIPSSAIPEERNDLEALKPLLAAPELGNCRIEGQRRQFSDNSDEDDMHSMGYARVNTHISIRCEKGRINANVSTYWTRFGALYQSSGLTQCGEDYCQEAWTSGRQLFVITRIRD